MKGIALLDGYSSPKSVPMSNRMPESSSRPDSPLYLLSIPRWGRFTSILTLTRWMVGRKRGMSGDQCCVGLARSCFLLISPALGCPLWRKRSNLQGGSSRRPIRSSRDHHPRDLISVPAERHRQTLLFRTRPVLHLLAGSMSSIAQLVVNVSGDMHVRMLGSVSFQSAGS